jgi:hypothetical protein
MTNPSTTLTADSFARPRRASRGADYITTLSQPSGPKGARAGQVKQPNPKTDMSSSPEFGT